MINIIQKFRGCIWKLWLLFPDSLRLRFYKAVTRIARKHWNGDTTLYVTRLPFGIYIKKAFNAFEEVTATRYVEENTSIPVPHIFDCVSAGNSKRPREGLIVMQAVLGEELGTQGIPLHALSEQQQDIFVETLRGWFEQLRSLPPPDERIISGFLGGGLFSFRIGDIIGKPFGPYPSQHEFHAEDFCTPWKSDDEELNRALDIRSTTQYKICLTHGDLTPHNILVDKNFRPVALIDWETASWMPEYWEYTRALYVRERYVGWREAFKRIFPGYESELIVERAIGQHWIP
ncbi:kinase-like domain-containing protein [Crassisporium funariophilum]|nr:kinase-like domain-containing protein [Crassisporium funariophilum]